MELTCTTLNVVSTSLRWTHDNEDIAELQYLYAPGEFPLSIGVSSEEGYINYTIITASFDPNVPTIVNFTAQLVVDLAILFNDFGYRSLQCGSLAEKSNFTFEMDIESM